MRILESSVDNSGDALVLKRVYDAPITRIFRAWVDVNELKRWYTPNPAWPARISDMDMRIHGGFAAAFGAPGESPWIERVQFLDIDPPTRIETLGHMTRDGAFVALTRVTIDLRARGDSATDVTLTERGCNAAQRADRASGWGGTMDNLATLPD